MSSLQEVAGKAEREQKHIAICREIERLDLSVARLRDLRDRISGEGQANATGTEKNQPALAYVLSQAPDEIRQKSGEINDLIADIESLLF